GARGSCAGVTSHPWAITRPNLSAISQYMSAHQTSIVRRHNCIQPEFWLKSWRRLSLSRRLLTEPADGTEGSAAATLRWPVRLISLQLICSSGQRVRDPLLVAPGRRGRSHIVYVNMQVAATRPSTGLYRDPGVMPLCTLTQGRCMGGKRRSAICHSPLLC